MNNRINLADIQINVMASPQRRENAIKLAKILDAKIFFDFDQQGCWWNARRCWNYTNGKKYILVIQDDCLPTRHFKDHIVNAINEKPNHVISLFKGKMFSKGSTIANENQWSWLLTKYTMTAQATILPSTLCQEWLAWDVKTLEQNPKDIDDVHLRFWEHTFNINNWHTIPDLIQHLGNFNKGQFRSIVWNTALYTHSSINFDYNLPKDYSFELGKNQTVPFTTQNPIYRIKRKDGKEIILHDP